MDKKIPKEVTQVSSVLTDAGFESYLVGGCVRDLVLEKTPKDWDIATSATPEEIIELFEHTFYENQFGTVGVVIGEEDSPVGEKMVERGNLDVIEITPFRKETEYSDARHPNRVEWADTIEEDLSRRDFTMNAMALEVGKHPVFGTPSTPGVGETSRLIDPFGGENDIKKKLIRTVGKPEERFREDALRMLRALRFSSELDFAIELETQTAIQENATLLEKISKERIRDEFIKIVMSENPGAALDIAARLGIIKYISPEFEKGIGVEQNQAHAYTVWEHLLRSLNHAAKKDYPLHVRLAALFHDIAKPHTKSVKGGEPTFYGHEVVGSRIAKKVLEDLRFPKEVIEKVVKLVRWHMFFSDTEQISLSAVRRMVRNVGTDLIWDLMNTRTADRIGTGRPKETPYRLRKYKSMIEEVMRDPVSVKQLKVDGEDVMKITETLGGPHVGFILEILLSEVLEKPELNTKEYLEKRVQELHSLAPDKLKNQGIAAKKLNAGEEEREIEKIREEYKVK